MPVDLKLSEWIKANRLKFGRSEIIEKLKSEGHQEKDIIDTYDEVVKVAAKSAMPVPKEKSVAILLAVFLGLFTWVYTYQKDATKFWINLIVAIITLGIWGFVAWIWAIILAATRPDEFYSNYPNG